MSIQPPFHAALIVSALLSAPLAQAADEVRYLPPRPLVELVAGDVAPVRGGDRLRLPVLGRGADVVAVQALEHGLFAAEGLDVELVPGNDFVAQVEAARDGSSPYLRGTVEMIQAAAEVFARAGVELSVVVPLAWSSGGDALVARSSIAGPRALAGKTIALQRHGPHVGYLHDLLRRSGLSMDRVTLRWLAEPTLPLEDSGAVIDAAGAFLADPAIDAVLAFAPDALALTSGGKTGSGAAGSVAGARILESTARAPRRVADVYAVRGDYLTAHPDRVEALGRALDRAREKLAVDLADATAREGLLARAAIVLLGSPHAAAEVAALVDGVELIDPAARAAFFADDARVRRGASSRAALAAAGLGKSKAELGIPPRYRPPKPEEPPVTIAVASEPAASEPTASAPTASAPAATPVAPVEPVEQAERFAEAGPAPSRPRTEDPATGSPAVETEREPAALAPRLPERAPNPAERPADRLRLAIPFAPNDATVAAASHAREFDRVHEALRRSPGAEVVIEGQVDARRVAAARRDGASPLELHLLAQQARNLALRRAQAVRASLLLHCAERDAATDGARFRAVGRGVAEDAGDGVATRAAVVVRVVEPEAEPRPRSESAP